MLLAAHAAQAQTSQHNLVIEVRCSGVHPRQDYLQGLRAPLRVGSILLWRPSSSESGLMPIGELYPLADLPNDVTRTAVERLDVRVITEIRLNDDLASFKSEIEQALQQRTIVVAFNIRRESLQDVERLVNASAVDRMIRQHLGRQQNGTFNRIAVAHSVVEFDSIGIGAMKATRLDTIPLIGQWGGKNVYARYSCPWRSVLRGEGSLRSFRLYELVPRSDGAGLALRLPPLDWTVSTDTLPHKPSEL